MPIRHKFVSTKPDPVDPALVKGSNWNADHLYPAYTVYGMTFGDDGRATQYPPAALDAPYGSDFRTHVDLTHALQARLIAYPSANAGGSLARMAVQYSLDQATWAYLDGVDGPFVSLAAPLTLKASDWITITPAARADVWLRWVTSGGNGQSIQWYQHYLQVR